MGKKKTLIICPWCGGQNIIDELALGTIDDVLALGDIVKGIKRPIEKPDDVILFEFTCLDCGKDFTAKHSKKDSYTEKDIPED